MDMGIRIRDQTNERTWTAINLRMLDFMRAGCLSQRIEWFATASFFMQVHLHRPSNEREGYHRVPER